jgi:hypothetical protein
VAKLTRSYDTADLVPEAFRDYYVERDGKFQLELDAESGGDDLAKVKRALDSERRVRANEEKQRKELEIKLAELEANPPKGDADDSRVKAWQKRIETLEAAVKAADDKSAAAERRLADTRIAEALRAAAIKIGVEAKAVEDVIMLPYVRSPWKLDENGRPQAFDGESLLYSEKRPDQPIPADEFLAAQLKDKPHYFPPSSGANTAGSSGTRHNGQQFVISRADAKESAKYEAGQAAAKAAGKEFVVAAD